MRFTASLLTAIFLLSAFSPSRPSEVELVCLRTNKASNTCYFNFRVDGVKYCYTDVGCKGMKKREQLIKKIREGRLALSRDWKIDCPERPAD